MASGSAGAELPAKLLTELTAELPHEFIEWRARRRGNLIVLLVVTVLLEQRGLRGGGNLHANGNHRGLHFGNNVGKAAGCCSMDSAAFAGIPNSDCQ